MTEIISQPETRIVLLAVVGMSPSVLTETVWALAHEPEPVIPDRIIAVTTAGGKRQIEKRLFEPLQRFGGRSGWEALRAALKAEGIDLAGKLRFGATGDDVRVIAAHDPDTGLSKELTDLRSAADNVAAADFILEQTRAIVENPDTSLVASIAGGRKTMGSLLYACLTLIGRETDRLTHVLVDEPFETMPEFYFPGQPGGRLADRDGKAHDPAKVRVELADVPFVPLRNLFLRELGQPAGSFGRLVDLCRANVRRSVGEALRIEMETRKSRSTINGKTLKLNSREHLVFLFLARRAKEGATVLSAYDEALVDLNEFRRDIRNSAPEDDWSDWRHHESLGKEFDARELVRVLSDIRKKAKAVGGDAALLASVLPEKGRCSLDVPGALIHIK